MSHLPGVRARPPILSGAHRDDRGAVTLTWRADGDLAKGRHAIYRVDVSGTDSPQLVAAVASGSGTRRWVDQTATPGRAYAYCVTTLDRLWNESAASIEQVVPLA
jgi:hypothetical protein